MSQIASLFEAKFNKAPDLCVQAPTRINIIGEHTDYNGGFVLPAAINHYVYFGVVKSHTPIAFIFDENKQEQFAFDLDDKIDVHSLSPWRKYFYGAIKLLQEKYAIGGFQVMKFGQAPVGAGISSSAALCCGFIFTLNELFALKMDKWEIARIARKVEQDYVGLNCGIMDQFAVLFGEKNTVLSLNCNTLQFDKHSIALGDFQFVLCNSMVQHQLSDSAYNDRVAESAEIIEVINSSRDKQLKSLIEMEMEDLECLEKTNLQKRGKHFLSENQRVQNIILALQNKDFQTVGDLLSAGHASLRQDYEVTCEETNDLVAWFMEHGALGARQMGGGFGGCVLALIPSQRKSMIAEAVVKAYEEKFGIKVAFINFEISDGVKRM